MGPAWNAKWNAKCRGGGEVVNTEDEEAGELNELSGRVVGACIEVHRHLGPGLLESTYEECLAHELTLAGLGFDRQKILPVVYKGVALECGYRLDLLVEGRLVVELKAIDQFLPVHMAQVITYLKLLNLPLGLLINFNVPALRQGIKRVVNRFPSPSIPSTRPSSPPSPPLPLRPLRLCGESDE